ncbi:hypothetical protein [Paraliobacillus sp. X-1268]|uniref:hypothetical protein n=1 Tax=Paraliobacillus sp. X-1268 TaxID=2213193 RepID=UPI000E3DF774|nr:hypothetical protein [Paraliobacillus sp. X-1268]
MHNDNKIAKAIFILGIIEMVAGIILGIFLGNEEVSGVYGSYNEFSWSLFVVCAISGLISGLLFIGFSEIINLLDKNGSVLKTLDKRVRHIEDEVKEKAL